MDTQSGYPEMLIQHQGHNIKFLLLVIELA